MISCIVLQDIPTYGLRARQPWQCPWSCCSLLPWIHHHVPPVINLALRCMYGLGITNPGCSGKFRAWPCSSPLPAHSVLLCSPPAIGQVPPAAAASGAAPSPSHPPTKKRMQLCKTKARTKQKRAVLYYFLFWAILN